MHDKIRLGAQVTFSYTFQGIINIDENIKENIITATVGCKQILKCIDDAIVGLKINDELAMNYQMTKLLQNSSVNILLVIKSKKLNKFW